MLKQIKQRDKSSVFFFPCKLFCIYFYFCPQIIKATFLSPMLLSAAKHQRAH